MCQLTKKNSLKIKNIIYVVMKKLLSNRFQIVLSFDSTILDPMDYGFSYF